jgi:hypothetical protein
MQGVNAIFKKWISRSAFRHIDGLSIEEICKELNINATDSRVMLYCARIGLRDCLEENWIDGSNKTDRFWFQGSKFKGYYRWTLPTLLIKIPNTRHIHLDVMALYSFIYMTKTEFL